MNILLQQLVEVLSLEDINPHGGQRAIFTTRHGGRIGRFFDEGADLALLVDIHDPEGGCLGPRHLDTGDRHLGAKAHVVEQHGGVIHLVDVIPASTTRYLGP